ncbi:MAG: hypothetical protein FJ333_02035 [Sphingomonadales bacterium]|nr:hypothetical protein [Sphingomonadales bacterium]
MYQKRLFCISKKCNEKYNNSKIKFFVHFLATRAKLFGFGFNKQKIFFSFSTTQKSNMVDNKEPKNNPNTKQNQTKQIFRS